ncbi:DUF4270 domain-containing protein [Flavobacterium sp.]|uniref:DUF4270 domain-containing protein n=1 Tax=Flavobacterium sp. TaxID=239 RepID=UPI0025FC6B5A|nr:DUF4270 domain-containing protein [Flavobacterium sp.]
MFKKSFLQQFAFGLMALSLLVSCDKDFNEIGTDIVGDDHFGFDKYTGATVKAYNQKLGPIASNNLPINPLGFYQNPAFGTTQANFVTQVELGTTNPQFNNIDPEEYDTEPTAIDSVVLEVPYFSKVVSRTGRVTTYKLDSIYGNPESKFRLSVYQSNYYLRDLDPDQSLGQQQLFYTDMDAEINNFKVPTLLNDLPLSDPRNNGGRQNEAFFYDKNEHMTPIVDAEDNSVDSLRSAPSMRLNLNKEVFTNLILNAPSGQLANNQVFKNYFRGLYFKTESTGNPGSMAMLNFKGGKITIYYNEDQKTIDEGQTVFTRVNKTLLLNFTGNTVSLLNNSNENPDYLNATANTTQEAARLYLKGGQGAMAVIDVFGADADNNGIADEIEAIKANGWMINEANLTFYVDQTAMNNTETYEPNRIFLFDLNNKTQLVDYIFDGSSNGTYPKFNKFIHGGIIEKEVVQGVAGRGLKYKIRITNHVRNLISRDSTNVRLGLVVTENINNVGFSKLKTPNASTLSAPSMSVLNPLGTILYGSDPSVPEDKRLKLEIYYTKPD